MGEDLNNHVKCIDLNSVCLSVSRLQLPASLGGNSCRFYQKYVMTPTENGRRLYKHSGGVEGDKISN